MKKKKTLYVGFIVVGLCLAAASLLLRGTLPDSAGGTLMGSGSGMAVMFLCTGICGFVISIISWRNREIRKLNG